MLEGFLSLPWKKIVIGIAALWLASASTYITLEKDQGNLLQENGIVRVMAVFLISWLALDQAGHNLREKALSCVLICAGFIGIARI